MSEKLKACPFCGEPASEIMERRGIVCTYCGAKMIYDLDPKKQLAIKAWNTRTPDINAEMLDALKECVVFQCQMCTGDVPEDCEGNGITCDYHDYKTIILKAEKEQSHD